MEIAETETNGHYIVKFILWVLPTMLLTLEWLVAVSSSRVPFWVSLLLPIVLLGYLTAFSTIFGLRLHIRKQKVDVFRPSSASIVWIIFCGLFSWIPAWALVDLAASQQAHNCFNKVLTRIDSFYLALGIFTTNGTGNLSPKAQWCHTLIAAQMGVNWIVIVVYMSIVIGTVIAIVGGRSSNNNSLV